jgi:hypothetical protein
MSTDDEDLKVKQLLEPASEADLERWFSLPSFQQLADQPPPAPAVVDEEMQAATDRRQRALAAVDPALVENIRVRTQERPETLLKFKATIDVRVDTQFGLLDEGMIDRAYSIAEPREVEISEELRDDLRDCTPQALLRDLHRAEFDFDKQFEIVDVAAEQRFDIVAEVASAMATSWKLPKLEQSPVIDGHALLDAARAARQRPWTEYLPALHNRRVNK